MGTHLGVLRGSSPMYTNMTGIRWLSKNLSILVLWTKVASELEGLKELKKNLKLLSIKKILYLEEKLGKKMIQDNHSHGTQNGTPHY